MEKAKGGLSLEQMAPGEELSLMLVRRNWS